MASNDQPSVELNTESAFKDAKHETGDLPWWGTLLLGLCLYSGPMVLLPWRPMVLVLVEARRIPHFLSGLAGICVVLAVCMKVLHRNGSNHGSSATSRPAHGKGRLARKWLAVSGSVGLAVGAEMATEIAAAEVHRHIVERFPDASGLYANHDIANLVGNTIQAMLCKVRDAIDDENDREVLTQIAAVVPDAWLAMATGSAGQAPDPRVKPLTEKELWVFVQDPSTQALDEGRWSGLLDEWSRLAHVGTLGDVSRKAAVEELSGTFAFAWREALKHDYVSGGKAAAAMQLDMFGEILRRTASGATNPQKDTLAALARLNELPQELQRLREQVMVQQDEYSKRVLAQFDSIMAVLHDIGSEVHQAREAAEDAASTGRRSEGKLDTLMREVGLLKEVHGIILRMLDNGLLVADLDQNEAVDDVARFQEALSLGLAQGASPSEAARRVNLSPPLRKFIAGMAVNATLLDKHRAAVVLGDLTEADRLADAYERERSTQRSLEDYAFAVTRGDRYWTGEDYLRAGEWYRRAVAIHGDDAPVVNRLALSLIWSPEQAEYVAHLQEAERLLGQEVQTARAASPGGDSPDIAMSLHNLAFIVNELGRASEAEPMLREVLEMNQRLHGKADDPDVASSLTSLGTVVALLNRPLEAKPLFDEALGMRRRMYAGAHADIAMSLNNVAYVEQSLGRAEAAESMFAEALDMYRGLHTGDHRDIAMTLTNLGLARHARGRTEEADSLLGDALEMYRRLYPAGEDHPDVAAAVVNLTAIKEVLGRSEEAERLSVEGLAMARRLYKEDRSDLALAIHMRGSVLHNAGRREEALPLYKEALEMRLRLYPDTDHPDVAMSYNKLGFVLAELGKPAEAEPWSENALEMNRRLYPGMDHPDIVMSLHNLGWVRYGLGKVAEAEGLLEEAVRMGVRVYPPGHPDLRRCQESLAACRRALGK